MTNAQLKETIDGFEEAFDDIEVILDNEDLEEGDRIDKVLNLISDLRDDDEEEEEDDN